MCFRPICELQSPTVGSLQGTCRIECHVNTCRPDIGSSGNCWTIIVRFIGFSCVLFNLVACDFRIFLLLSFRWYPRGSKIGRRTLVMTGAYLPMWLCYVAKFCCFGKYQNAHIKTTPVGIDSYILGLVDSAKQLHNTI